ncbi:hypothetical protein RHECNPAF_2330083 [Rhizobium etli CNPAF512]|nr:hypothetical protein RHECNPAF_2330083 [Rhizobium etli CNPAF512]
MANGYRPTPASQSFASHRFPPSKPRCRVPRR